uniref:Uncharacterized protein n=1 Tax=Glossina austeni TaxID=7395 RepID=A0A1A9UV04_GLOAU
MHITNKIKHIIIIIKETSKKAKNELKRILDARHLIKRLYKNLSSLVNGRYYCCRYFSDCIYFVLTPLIRPVAYRGESFRLYATHNCKWKSCYRTEKLPENLNTSDLFIAKI